MFGLALHDSSSVRSVSRGRIARAVMAASCAAAGLFAAAGSAQATTHFSAYVGNYGSGTLTPINTATNATSSAIAAKDPSGIAITPDATTALVANWSEGSVTPITLATNTAGAAITVGTHPGQIAITPDGKTAYVTNTGSATVTPINLTTMTAGTPITVGTNPYAIAITPGGTKAYVANDGSETVTPINTATNTAGTAIKVGKRPEAIAITPNGATAWVGNYESNSLTPINVSNDTTGSSVSVNSPDAIAITPDGTTAYVVDYTQGTVTPITLSTETAGSAITVGNQPLAIAITPDQATAYVANYNADLASTVTPINLSNNTAGSAISVGNGPDSVAVTPDQAPAASFTATPGVAGAVTSLDASASTVAYGTITNYRWQFGDGQSAETTSSTTTHSYATAGSYTVTLTETDSAGTSTTQTFTGQTMSRAGGSVAQTTRSLTVNSVPQVTTQPGSETVTAPNTASFTTACSGSPAPAAQWQVSSDGGSSWSNIAGQTSPILVISPTAPALSGFRYRALCANVAGSAISNPATLTVNSVPSGSGNPTSKPAASDPPVRVAISSGPVTVGANGVVAIVVNCPRSAVGGCRGTVTLALVAPRARRARAVAAKCARGCRSLGSSKYEARAGSTVRVRVHMASVGRGLLARRKALRVTVTVTSVAAGQVSTSQGTVTLRTH